MKEAKQSFCVIAGGKEFIRDSILAAMLAKNQIFPSLNMLVVPVEMEVADDRKGTKGLAKGFGNSSLSYEEEGYVAAPVNVSIRGFALCVLHVPNRGIRWSLYSRCVALSGHKCYCYKLAHETC